MTALLDLSPEVLYHIYDWLRLIESRDKHYSQTRNALAQHFTWAPISRALLPYTQAYRFHTAYITNYQNWTRLATTLKRSPHLGLAVRVVVLDGAGARLYHQPATDAGVEALAEAREAWGRMGRVREVRVRGFETAWEGLEGAIEGGCRFEVMRDLEVGGVFEGRENALDWSKWRALLEGMPALEVLHLDPASRFPPDISEPVPDLPSTDAAPFETNLKTLKLDYTDARQEGALARFANAFPALNTLDLSARTGRDPPAVVPLLRLPGLRELGVRWRVRTRMMPRPFVKLDVRHLVGLTGLTFGARWCSPDFAFLLPPSLTRLVIEWDNNVPLAALLALVTQDSPFYHLTLKQIKLDLPFGGHHGTRIEHLSDDDLAELGIVEADLMQWTGEVSEEGLEELIGACEERGVELTGSCRAVWRFAEAFEWLEQQREEQWRQDEGAGAGYGGAFDN